MSLFFINLSKYDTWIFWYVFLIIVSIPWTMIFLVGDTPDHGFWFEYLFQVCAITIIFGIFWFLSISTITWTILI